MIYIIIIITLYLMAVHYAKNWVHDKVAHVKVAYPLVKEYRDVEHDWKPTYNLEHHALKVFNIPFVPERNEVFYIENEYDEEANLFIQENLELIKTLLGSKGLTFVYLPLVRVSMSLAESMVAYHNPNLSARKTIGNNDLEKKLSSDFLLDYMVYPQNRPSVTCGFCWYNTTFSLFDFKKRWYVFDYISFDGAEARKRPREVLEDMLPELGTRKIWRKGCHCEVSIESESFADDNFEEETRKILADIQDKLNAIRLKGVSEAIIARYIKPCPKLSRLTVSSSFTITLNDYNNTVITMEPIVKAVFLLFLRHEEGILFKELSDYQAELEIIYRAVKARKNDIDEKLSSGFTPQISSNVKRLTSPLSNLINEKCTRIKESFIVHFHDSIASNYYIQGSRASKKLIIVPRNLVIWEK